MSVKLDYIPMRRGTTGIFAALPGKLRGSIRFSRVLHYEFPRSGCSLLCFQDSGQRVLCIAMVHSGKNVSIEMAGRAQTAETVNICRDHFDDWFGDRGMSTASRRRSTRWPRQTQQAALR